MKSMVYRVEEAYKNRVGWFVNQWEYEDTLDGLQQALGKLDVIVRENVEAYQEFSGYQWKVWLTKDRPDPKPEPVGWSHPVPSGELLAHLTNIEPEPEEDCKHINKGTDYEISVETADGRVTARGTPEFCNKWVTSVEM